MNDILALLQCFAPYVSKTTLRQMSVIIPAMISMSGRVTMRGISRWTDKGGSYRTVQRFFHTIMPWSLLFWLFFRHQLYNSDDSYFLVGDESVVTKSGKQTYGLDRFFSGLLGIVVPSLAFFTLSLISVKERTSYPMMTEQRIRSEAEKQASKSKSKKRKGKKKSSKKGKVGRPKGSKNKDKTQVKLTEELQQIKAMVKKQLVLINGLIPIQHLVLDGHFGNNNALQMTIQCGLDLVSKLRNDSALYFFYEGSQKNGRPRQYGDRINYNHIPDKYLKQSTLEEGIREDIYQATMLHRSFAQVLNIVIIVKTNLKTGKRAHVVLFSSDLKLSFDTLVDYYRLRFQIEFNFRDAKQYWGLEDFMTVTETAVTNAANLSLFMVNISHLLLREFRQTSTQFGILDLKAHFRGRKYVMETLKLLPQMPEPILTEYIFDKIAQVGAIRTSEIRFNSP